MNLRSREPLPFKESLDLQILALSPRNQEIIRKRIGYNAPSLTLQAIGNEYGMTRERIRQIDFAFARAAKSEKWPAHLDKVLHDMLDDLGRPFEPHEALTLPWMRGSAPILSSLSYILEHICDSSLRVLQLQPSRPGVIAPITADDWSQLLLDANAVLEGVMGGRENYCKKTLIAWLPSDRKVLGNDLWDVVTSKAIWLNRNGHRHLLSLSHQLKPTIRGIIAALDTPAHLQEITGMAEEVLGEPLSPSSVHALLTNHAIPLGHSIYGNESHIHVSPATRSRIIDIAENAVIKAHDRQWHVTEFIPLIKEGVPDLNIDKYVLDHVLHGSRRLVSGKRFSWRLKEAGSERLEIIPVATQILTDAGSPLSLHELCRRISLVRGINAEQSITILPPLIRIDRGVIGLIGRDA